jgi:hypothetical protein
MFFSYDGTDKTFKFHETAEEAKKEAERLVLESQEISAGWKRFPEDADTCWGTIKARAAHIGDTELQLIDLSNTDAQGRR